MQFVTYCYSGSRWGFFSECLLWLENSSIPSRTQKYHRQFYSWSCLPFYLGTSAACTVIMDIASTDLGVAHKVTIRFSRQFNSGSLPFNNPKKDYSPSTATLELCGNTGLTQPGGRLKWLLWSAGGWTAKECFTPCTSPFSAQPTTYISVSPCAPIVYPVLIGFFLKGVIITRSLHHGLSRRREQGKHSDWYGEIRKDQDAVGITSASFPCSRICC